VPVGTPAWLPLPVNNKTGTRAAIEAAAHLQTSTGDQAEPVEKLTPPKAQ